MTTEQPSQIKKHVHKLGELASTAICGNDITSSVLYVSGIAIGVCGVFAPLVLLFIGFLLFIYKGVYREVVESLPVNGGAYNALLNGTSKRVAAIAGVLTVLSYIATSVISGKSAVEYLNTLLHFSDFSVIGLTVSPILIMTTIVLAFFALLVISGVKDSSKVALGIFGLHLFTLVSFVIFASLYLFQHDSQFSFNISATQLLINKESLPMLLFLGFSAALLGVSGFESSADFVEEQQKGVFKKTLRNMLIGVIIFNPLVSFLTLNLDSLEHINASRDFLLASEAQLVGGSWFQQFVVVDAFLVLCGAVLTSFIGISGLVKRMALDEILPSWLARTNTKGSYPRIIMTFWIFCISILFLTGGNLLALGGVYAISFLSVMSMFALGNVVLKITRSDLKRMYTFPVVLVLLASVATLSGVLGNIILNPLNLLYFLLYFTPIYVFVLLYMNRHHVALLFHRATKNHAKVHELTDKILHHVTRGTYILFLHRPDRLFEALRYIDHNETGQNVIIIHCKDTKDIINHQAWLQMKKIVPLLPEAGVFKNLHIQLHQLNGEFGPGVIDEAAHEFNVPKNRIFIGSIKNYHRFNYDELGGVRIII